jgi:hypothetical protein
MTNQLLRGLVAALATLVSGCALKLPFLPATVTQPVASGTFSGDRCHVRFEPLQFDATVTWDGQLEPAYVAALNPKDQQNHEEVKRVAIDTYTQQLDLNAADYLGDKGTISTKPRGNEPLVIRTRVINVDTRVGGGTTALFEVFDVAQQRKVGEFTVNATGNRYMSVNLRTKISMMWQASSVLKFLSDHYGCKAPPVVP